MAACQFRILVPISVRTMEINEQSHSWRQQYAEVLLPQKFEARKVSRHGNSTEYLRPNKHGPTAHNTFGLLSRIQIPIRFQSIDPSLPPSLPPSPSPSPSTLHHINTTTQGGREPLMSIDVESLVEATSGAVGALVSTTILYPLDTCKTKYQAENRAHHHQKYRNISDVLWEAISKRQVLSLYQGLGAKNLQSFISQFIYFYGYSFFKRLYLRESRAKSIGTSANLIIAGAAGACTAIITQPLDTASSRMQTSEFGKSKGLWESLSEGTWSDAFDGLGISLLLTSNPSIQYTVFDQLKQRLLKGKLWKQSDDVSSQEALSAFSAFVLGAVSKCIATCLTYPAIRCKVMIQSAKSDENEEGKTQPKPRKKTVSGTVYSIWEKEGISGFFKGLQAQMLKTVLTSALLLTIKEKIAKSTWVLMIALRRFMVARPKLKSS